jgi:hypothetical protein
MEGLEYFLEFLASLDLMSALVAWDIYNHTQTSNTTELARYIQGHGITHEWIRSEQYFDLLKDFGRWSTMTDEDESGERKVWGCCSIASRDSCRRCPIAVEARCDQTTGADLTERELDDLHGYSIRPDDQLPRSGRDIRDAEFERLMNIAGKKDESIGDTSDIGTEEWWKEYHRNELRIAKRTKDEEDLRDDDRQLPKQIPSNIEWSPEGYIRWFKEHFPEDERRDDKSANIISIRGNDPSTSWFPDQNRATDDEDFEKYARWLIEFGTHQEIATWILTATEWEKKTFRRLKHEHDISHFVDYLDEDGYD